MERTEEALYIGSLAEDTMKGTREEIIAMIPYAVQVIAAITMRVPFDLEVKDFPDFNGTKRTWVFQSYVSNAAVDDRGPWETILIPNQAVIGQIHGGGPNRPEKQDVIIRRTEKGLALLPAIDAVRLRVGEHAVMPATFALHLLIQTAQAGLHEHVLGEGDERWFLRVLEKTASP